MEPQPPAIEAILNRLREHAAQRHALLIVEARIAITPREFRLLDIQPVRPLEIIHF
jgi:hypothetical protein